MVVVRHCSVCVRVRVWNDSAHLAALCLTHYGGFGGLEGSAPGSAIIALFYIRCFTRNVCGLTYSDTHTHFLFP